VMLYALAREKPLSIKNLKGFVMPRSSNIFL